MSQSSMLLSLVLIPLLASCGGPVLVIPGGALSGEVVPTPANWEFAADLGTAQLETHPSEPYSVNISSVVIDGRLYAYAGESKTTWAANIEADPLVRYRLEGKVYELRAVRVEGKEKIETFGKAWTAKGSFLKDPTQFDEVWLFELVAR